MTLYEKIKTRRQDSLGTQLGELIVAFSKFLFSLGEELIYKIEEREVKIKVE